MRLTSSLLLASLPGALASLSLTKESKVVKTACTTSYASTNVKSVAHHSKVETLYPPPIIVLSTSTPSTTITPRPVTFWNTVFTTSTAYTTDVAITDDYTSTSTVFETDTITSTSTYTSVETDSTTITSTSTVTIPTSAGFLPIDDTPTNAYPNQKRWVGGRAAAAALENRQPGRQPPKGLDNCREHPASVTCTEIVDVIRIITVVVPAKKQKTITLRPKTVHSTKTLTVTTTSTIVPEDVCETLTTLSTSTVQITTQVVETASSTTTTTFTGTATTSFYAACATNNILGPVLPNENNDVISDVIHPALDDPVVNSATTAYDCCVACITGQCQAAAFDQAHGVCYNFATSQCSAGQASYNGYYVYSSPSESFLQLAVSNGGCGYVYNGGSS